MPSNENFPLSITLGAVDRLTAPLTRIQARLSRAFKPLALVGSRLRTLGATAGLPRLLAGFRGVGAAVGGVVSQVGRLAFRLGGLAAIGGGAALVLVTQYGRAGDEIAKTARKLGIGVEALQELRFAADRSGIEQSQIDKGLELFTRTIGETALGLGEGRVAFQALGISVVDAAGKVRPFEELLEEVADKLAAVEDANLRNAVAAKLFGRSGVELTKMLALGSDEMAKLRIEARRLGGVLSEEDAAAAEVFVDRMTDMRLALAGVRNMIGGRVLPVLTQFAARLRDWLVSVQPRVEEFAARFMEKLPARLANLRELFGDLLERARPFVDFGRRIVERFGPARVVLVALAAAIGGPLLLSMGALLGALAVLGNALVATPFGLVLLGIVAVVAAGALLIAKWDEVGAFFRRIWSRIVGVFIAARRKVDSVLSQLGVPAEALGAFWTAAAVAVEAAVARIVDAFRLVDKEGNVDVLKLVAGPGGAAALRGVADLVKGEDAPPSASNLTGGTAFGTGRHPDTGPPARGESRVRVSFENVPPGVQVRPDSVGAVPVDLDVGFAMGDGR